MVPVPRMHLALKAYQELLRTVQEMDRSPSQAVRDSSQVIKSESICPSTQPCGGRGSDLSPPLADPLLPRQHLLPDGVPGALPRPLPQVRRDQAAAQLLAGPGGDGSPLPPHAGALLPGPRRPRGAGGMRLPCRGRVPEGGQAAPPDAVLVPPQSKRVRRRKKPRAPAALAPQPPSAAELEELWAGLAPQLQACLQVGGRIRPRGGALGCLWGGGG